MQGVTEVKRITIRKDGQIIETNTFILTFATPVPLDQIKAGYLNIEVRPYVPNPLRCFNCQKYGHGKNSCKGQLVCFRCSKTCHEGVLFQNQLKCLNCGEAHMASSKTVTSG